MPSDKKDQRPLSRKKRGYLLAILGGTLGAPIGWIISPLVLYILNKKAKSKDGAQPNIFKLWSLIGIIGAPISLLIPVFLFSNVENVKKVDSNTDYFITKEMFGDKWPFTVDEGAVFCKGNSIWFGHKGKFYALNGTAKAQFGYPFPDEIWRADPNPEMAKYGLKIPTTAIDEKARSQCK